MAHNLGGSYVPALTEWIITIGLAAAVVLMYLFVVENLPIYNKTRIGQS
jgi:Ni/Fe-hydrogenase subunit HybB-like protein